jgi:uncharacterized protein (DUF1501 family)
MERLANALPAQIDQLDLAGDNHNRVNAAHRILVAMQAGVCATGSMRTGANYDSHSNHDTNHGNGTVHLTRLLDYIWTKAAELGIANRLIVHVTSDVGRTPRYNNNNGKDHWSNGSAVIMMKNQSWTDRVVGLSGPKHEKLTIDPQTLQEDPDGLRLRTGHIHQALRQILGIDQHPLAQEFPLNLPSINVFGPNSSPVNV